MTRVEDALRKLRREGKPASRESSSTSRRTPAPIADKKKVQIEGPKHAIAQVDLVKGGLLAPLDYAGYVADEFRRIKRPLLQNAAEKLPDASDKMNVIMIASAHPGAGKTFCSVNLAVSISLERELNVLLVDADVAKPHISRSFGLQEAPGLIDLLVDERRDIGESLVRTDLNDIQVLPAGRSHPQATELLASDRMSAIVSELAKRYSDRIIILDSPPLLVTSEAQALAGQVGQIALIVEAGRTTHEVLQQTIDTLDPDIVKNLILNKSSRFGRKALYGDYAYYGYAAA